MKKAANSVLELSDSLEVSIATGNRQKQVVQLTGNDARRLAVTLIELAGRQTDAHVSRKRGAVEA